MSDTTTASAPTRNERELAAYAVRRLWLRPAWGHTATLWAARKHHNLFVRRWAWLSITFVGMTSVITAAMLALMAIFVITNGSPPVVAFLFALSLGDLLLRVLTVPLANRARQGHDAASRWIPGPLARRLPQDPNPH